MNINLNDDSFNSAQGVAIFNGGNAGTVENVKVSLVKKSAEDKEMAPDYKILFTDSNGASCNTPLWYVTKATQWQSVEQLIKKQGKILKHLLHGALGPNAQLPVVSSAEASSLKAGDLDGMTRLVEDAVSTGGEVNAVVADDEADW